jgi:hypothetical protein
VSTWLADPHIQTICTCLLAVAGSISTYLKSRATSKTVARVELNVNGRMSTLLARVDQLTAALTAVNAEVPESPSVIVDPHPAGDIIIKNAVAKKEDGHLCGES